MTAIASPAPEPFKTPAVKQTPTVKVEFRPRRILYVVHRYAPYPGGSENYVRDMAEETRARGHFVAVFAGEHKGDRNGVIVSSEPSILSEHWDLIVVHGGDVGIQNFVLKHAGKLGGPVMYLLIMPSNTKECVEALHQVTYIGCSTLADWRHVKQWNVDDRAVRVRHGIDALNSSGRPGFRELYGIKTPYMFLSSGGYWPNKAFDELVGVFKETKRTDTTLVLTGYDNRFGIMPPDEEFVRSFLFTNRQDMLDALLDTDLYILNSYAEGFGLVLLEAMLNMTPWVGRHIAGAELMREYGFTYTKPSELQLYLQLFRGVSNTHLLEAQKYVISTHLVKHTVSDILAVFK
jgi:glycosyltransferase involved in cell wall biosynthesis